MGDNVKPKIYFDVGDTNLDRISGRNLLFWGFLRGLTTLIDKVIFIYKYSNILNTRSSGCSTPFLLAPVEGFEAGGGKLSKYWWGRISIF